MNQNFAENQKFVNSKFRAHLAWSIIITQKQDAVALNFAEKILETEKQKEIMNGLIHYVKNYGKVTG